MTVRSKKPSEIEETARVMRIFDWLAGELDGRDRAFAWRERPGDLVAVAERIAARTEDSVGDGTGSR